MFAIFRNKYWILFFLQILSLLVEMSDHEFFFGGGHEFIVVSIYPLNNFPSTVFHSLPGCRKSTI